MRYTTRHHADRDLVICTVAGPFSIGETLCMLDEVERQTGDGPSTAVVIDVRAQTTVPSADDVARIVARLATRPFRRLAIVSSRPADFGMSRMLATEASLHGLDVDVFIDLGEAVAWAGRRPAAVSGPPALHAHIH